MRESRISTISLVSLVLLLISCSSQQSVQIVTPINDVNPVKNVILLIGDGMGLTQISAAAFTKNRPLALEGFSNTGLHKPYSYDNLVTDSAAGGTAFSTGVKTFNGAIGMDKDSIPVETILEQAEKKGLATGLIATSSIVHATPAAFIAHQPNRGFYENIAADFLKTDIDYFVGGGKKYFDRRNGDDRNLYRELIDKGYIVTDYSISELEETVADTRRNFAYFTGDQHALPVTAGRTYLSFATKQALSFLEKRSEKGFFLMVEGSQIDWGGHSNDGNWMTQEVLDFDRAVEVALEYAKKNENTLVIVTADHECGGMCITKHSRPGHLKYKFSTNKHTASLVPVFAHGPHADLFSGIYENTDIYYKMINAFGWAPKTTASSRR
ncbi:MAG: alkaline phosphatase [Bacteroidota bacterium]